MKEIGFREARVEHLVVPGSMVVALKSTARACSIRALTSAVARRRLKTPFQAARHDSRKEPA
jgi:hypothetical protein